MDWLKIIGDEDWSPCTHVVGVLHMTRTILDV